MKASESRPMIFAPSSTGHSFAGRSVRALQSVIFAIWPACIMTASAMNFFEAGTGLLPWVFASFLFLNFAMLRKLRAAIPAHSSREMLFIVLGALVLSLPRLGYFLEPALEASVNAVGWDDWWHVQEMASLIYSESYPPKSTFVQNAFLSFYYAPWMVGATLYSTGLLATVKQALFFNYLLVYLFVLSVAVLAARVLFRDSVTLRRIFLGLLILYGGANFFFVLMKEPWLLPHREWWARAVFGAQLQYSSFFTLVMWVPHHLIGATTAVCALYFIVAVPSLWGGVVGGVFLAFSAFASIFALIGAIPLGFWMIVRYRRRIWSFVTASAVTGVLGLPLIWMYLERDGEAGFRLFGAFGDMVLPLSLVVFLIIVCTEFLPIVLGSRWIFRNGRPEARMAFLLASLFIGSTWMISYTGSNNYAGRGSIVSIWMLFYAATPFFREVFTGGFGRWARIAVIPFLLGGLTEFAHMGRNGYISLASVGPLNRLAYGVNTQPGSMVPDGLPAQFDEVDYGWYLVEKRKPQDKPQLGPLDLEIINSDNRYRFTLPRLLDKQIR